MDTNIGGGNQIDSLRKERLHEMAVDLAAKIRDAFLNQYRANGVVPNAAVTMTCSQLANVAADTIMADTAVVQSVLKISPDDVPAHLRNSTTQRIIDEVAAPAMAKDIADAMVKAGLVRPSLSIPPRGGVSVTFAGWACVMRQKHDGPASLPNAPRLDYGKGTSVFPRSGALSTSEIEGMRNADMAGFESRYPSLAVRKP